MIGRERETKLLNRLYDQGRAELVAVYGRRRVGKTYLIDETFAGRITFSHAGLAPDNMGPRGMLRAQLDHFRRSLELFGAEHVPPLGSWADAFFALEKHLQDIDDGKRQLVFLDELPWLDTPRSNFMAAFEGFWNNWGCHRKNLMVVVCGSASSWILDNLINGHGGLYNRVTYQIRLSPFDLGECERFYLDRGVRLSRYDIAQSYMIFGGVPYYLGYIDPELSLAQSIDAALFARNAPLAGEYERLFASLFTNPESVKAIVELLAQRNAGFTRKEITEQLGVSDGGRLSRNLNSLIASDFVLKYVPFGLGKREEHYKLIDPFCLFYLHFLNGGGVEEGFWQSNLAAPSVVAWRGLAFENVCFNHVGRIKAALGIAGVSATASAWSKRGRPDGGMQIDLILERGDNVVNMCEIKYLAAKFTVKRDYYELVLRRQEALAGMVPPTTAVRSTLITTFGLERNEYSGAFTNVITLDDLFE